ncbi:MAG: PEP/pyruvate-binding domain-containing protein [Desulfobacterales bacterium]
MTFSQSRFVGEYYGRFKVFHELMQIKIREILLVSSHYDAFILEEDGSLASRLINEYRGLNLSLPPRVTRVASGCEALDLLKKKKFEMVITMPRLEDMDAGSLGMEIKKIHPGLPVILLSHSMRSLMQASANRTQEGIDRTYVWTGNSDLLLALVKNTEDALNAAQDTRRAGVRVLLLIEDSPAYRSCFLPLIYREIVRQTQSVLETGLNEEHRLLLMRARPKILQAENYEQAMELYRKYHDFLFGIISDARFPRAGKEDNLAGLDFLSMVRGEIPDLPLLMLSSEPGNREKAQKIPAVFLDKNSQNLMEELRECFLTYLGFGDFVFRMPDGREIGRAGNLRILAEKLPEIPDESIRYHADRNHFSNWIMSRSEIALASRFRKVKTEDFTDMEELRQYIISNIRELRIWQQKGVVAQFRPDNFDPNITDFVKIGKGSLGGKARSLAFMSVILQDYPELQEKYPDISISIPKTLVISTEGFEDFIWKNGLAHLAEKSIPDVIINKIFLQARMPDWLSRHLEIFLQPTSCPLSVRSSSRMEDAYFQPYAGVYETCMIPNNHPDISQRLRQLIHAIKLVYASTYYEGPKAFSRNTGNRHREESMAVIVQHMTGSVWGDYFYPSLSGVAQSHNFYPFSHIKPEHGIAHIALGLGKIVVEGGRALRFCPKYPHILPQFSTVDDMLKNSQHCFYALRMRNCPDTVRFRNSNLEKRAVGDAENELPVKMLASTYVPEEHRIRDSGYLQGPKVMTFAPVLKHGIFPLPDLISDLLELGRKAMGCPVEIEFSVNLSPDRKHKSQFFFLQMRPMVADQNRLEVIISEAEFQQALCRSTQSLGNGKSLEIADIVYVKPETFKPGFTQPVAEEIGGVNAILSAEKRPWLLIGPGRWGSSDPWLGIPVQWRHISGVKAIVELRNDLLKADPSQGSHFFQNITSLGIFYITVTEDGGEDFLDRNWLESLPQMRESEYLRHFRTDAPLLLKADGHSAKCVILKGE